ncbi:MAG: ABC transporter transmembrane domain-containing protein, partial [Bosea sp. (in: a-proteobacteria)]
MPGLKSRFFGWLESQIDVFAPFDERVTPPARVFPFMWSHLAEVRGWLVAILLTGLAFAGIEAMLYVVVGWFIDTLSSSTPEALWRDHSGKLIGLVVLIVILRPLAYFANHVVVDQVVVPQLTNRIRWRAHVYTLGHALSYFQNDFAGRLASRVVQVGQALRSATVEVIDDLWYVLVFVGVVIGFFWSTSIWLALPAAVWLVFYIGLMRYFIPRAIQRSDANSHARSKVNGRIVDAYTNILTVKLFARADA